LRDRRIAISKIDIEAVGDVAAGIDLHVDVGTQLFKNSFHRLATNSFCFVQLVLFHEWFEGAAAGNHLRDAAQLAGQAVFSDCGDHSGGQI
jgi:hypothetical protein